MWTHPATVTNVARLREDVRLHGRSAGVRPARVRPVRHGPPRRAAGDRRRRGRRRRRSARSGSRTPPLARPLADRRAARGRPRRPADRDHRRRHARADRSRALHRQPLDGPDGRGARRGGARCAARRSRSSPRRSRCRCPTRPRSSASSRPPSCATRSRWPTIATAATRTSDGAPPDALVMAAAVADFTPVERPIRSQDRRGATGSPSSSRPPRTCSPRSPRHGAAVGRRGGPARPSSSGLPRRPATSIGRPAKLARQGRRPARRERRQRGRLRLRDGHQPGHDPRSRRARSTSCRC